MLVLSRRKGESILLGDDKQIAITIVGIHGSQVRVGVDAPASLKIYRDEIYDDWKREQANGEETGPNTET